VGNAKLMAYTRYCELPCR